MNNGRSTPLIVGDVSQSNPRDEWWCYHLQAR